MNDESQRKKVLHYAFCLLPKSNRDVLEVILAFLKFVASYAGRNKDEPGNRMDLENLATVVAPNILYPRPKDSGKGKETVGVAEDAFLAISAVRMLMEYLDEFVLVPPEFERNIIVGSSDVAGRDLGRRGDVRFSAGNGAGSTLDALEAR